MSTGKRYFEKREILIKLLNDRKDEYGISRITRKELEKELNLGTTSINQTIKEINEDEMIIEPYNEFYKVNVNDLFEIKKYIEIKEIIEKILENPDKMYENENEVAKEFSIDRKRLQKIKTIIKCF